MAFRYHPRIHLRLSLHILKWLLLAIPLGMAIGSAVALFLWSLDRATHTQWETPWLLYLLPLGGLGIGLMYHWWGRSVEGGNNLVMEQIHRPGGGIPARMAPLVLIGTVATHLFGGSAGREGTAVQIGGSIASTFCRWLKLSEADIRILLMSGVAAGFGAVFGTPLTGAIFAMEVLRVGRISYEALLPCLVASIAGDWTTAAWGIPHTHYHIGAFAQADLVQTVAHFDPLLALKVAVAGAAFGLACLLFSEMAHGLQALFKASIPWPYVRPVVGGFLVIGLVFALGTRDYLGLGVESNPHQEGGVSIVSCFSEGGATWWSWWWKILFTTVTLSSGFKGGEVTPLFFIGAALGNVMARILGAPVDLFAGLGFVAVFAGATNTPIACTVMGIELFAAGHPELLNSGLAVYLAIACFTAYLFSGHSGIYLSQRIGTPKDRAGELRSEPSLRNLRLSQPLFGIKNRRPKETPVSEE